MTTLKRSYQVPSKYTRATKRPRTMETELTKLKKQVSKNKAELKYYDGYIRNEIVGEKLTNQSLFSDVYESDGLTTANPVFIGRKVYIRKIELRVIKPLLAQTDEIFLMWREKRQGKDLPESAVWPLAFDPEYHTMLRQFEFQSDTDCRRKHFTVDFGSQGRLVEFDEQGTAIAQGAIVSGDIKCQLNDPLSSPVEIATAISFRCWYTDA